MEHRSEETALEGGLGGVPLQQNRLASGEQRAEPVHFRAGVVQGRDAEKHIVVGGGVVDGLHPADWARAWCLSRMALGKPVVPEE